MEKEVKSILLGLVLLIFFSFLVAAQNHTVGDTENEISGDSIDKAYQCLRDELDAKTSLSLQEAVFSVLALGAEDSAIGKIESEKSSGEDCWPASGCKLKDTAQVLLAYNGIGRDTSGALEWISSKNVSAKGLTWFLEIDIANHEASECKVNYENTERTINVREDMTLSGDGGRCLSISDSGYWLEINDNCLDNEFSVSCDKDFITSLLYQKGAGETIFVTSETHSAPGLGTTNERVNVECFSSDGITCDYEGSLWASLALNKIGVDISTSAPYLIAFAEDNVKYFPSAFLYLITNRDDQYAQVIQSQDQGRSWQMTGTPYNRFYDTSLGMLALEGSGALELENAKNYLISIQTNEGCWNNNNVRDTAFVLYSGWRRGVSIDGGGETPVSCEGQGNYCEARFACLEAAGAVLNEFGCTGIGEVCCSVDVKELSCAEKGGLKCAANQRCSTDVATSSDGSCCLGVCENIEVENICRSIGGNCRAGCFSDEGISGESCPNTGDVCCVLKTEDEEERSLIPWIIGLGILIALVVLGIVYRNKIRLWLHKRKGKRKTSAEREGPRVGPRPPRRPPLPPPGFMPVPPPRIRTRPHRDNELEETMRKLREMSK